MSGPGAVSLALMATLVSCVTEPWEPGVRLVEEVRVDPGRGGRIVRPSPSESGVEPKWLALTAGGAAMSRSRDGAAPSMTAMSRTRAAQADGTSGGPPPLSDPGTELPLRWNEFQGADGRITHFYYFRPGYANAYYLPLLQENIADLKGKDVVVSIQPNFLRDPRPTGNFNSYVSPGGIPWATGAQKSDGKTGAELADLVTITAPRAVLEQVDELLENVLFDSPQIEIEARIVEINVSDDLRWGLSGTVSRGTPEEPDATFFQKGALTLPLNLKEGVELTLSALQDETTTSAFLEFVQNTENTDILSAPKMVVADGHRAVIETGGEVAVLSPTINAVGEVSAVTVAYRPTGVLLIVTPFVVADDVIQVVLTARVSTVIRQIVTAEFADGPLLNPVIGRRDAYSIVNVRSGQTIAIGGLVSEEDIDVESKVPLLGDIPLLGYIFKRRVRTKRVSRVIYLITARIVEPSETLR